MKISKLTMVFFLFIVLFVSSISEVNSNLSKKSVNTENNSIEKPKKAKKNIKPEENTFGKMVKAHTVLDKNPWNVERCDQIVIAKRTLIPDHEDYTVRQGAVITISAYYMNIFSEKHPDKLLHSILLSESKQLPVLVRGARGCVRVHGGRIHSVMICGNNEKEGKNLLKALMAFARCRGGAKVAPEGTKEKFKNVLRACGLNAGFHDPKILRRKIKALKKQNKKKKNHIRVSRRFYHPGFEGVPGTN